jgi:polysaccharide pyruvyl transferase WcaK-like protein
VPLIGIVYDPKVAAYIEALGMPSAGDVKDFNLETARAAVRSVVDDREKYVALLKSRSVEFEAMAREDAQQLLNLLQQPKKEKRRAT